MYLGKDSGYEGERGLDEIIPVSQTTGCDLTIPASDTTALIAAITSANGAGTPQTLCLTNSTYTLTAVNNTTDGANGLPSIVGDITIVGNGATITRDPAAPAFRLFHVASSGRLALDNLTISGGNSGSQNGGGIRNLGTLELVNATIENNSGTSGGGIRNNNNATLIATGSIIRGNISTSNGGGIYANTGSSTSLINTTLADNAANPSSGLGGGLFMNGLNLTISGGQISGNSARNGGGVFVNSAPNPTQINTGTQFTANSATNQGGGLYVSSGTVNLDGVTISGSNSAGSLGGGVRNGATLSIISSTIASNDGGSSGGGGIVNFGTLTITDSTINDNTVNTATATGGGVLNQGSLTISGGEINSNSARVGGGLLTNAGLASLFGVTLSGNTAQENGGGISVLDSGSLVLDHVTLEANAAGNYGGGLNAGALFSVDDSIIRSNTAGALGGGVMADTGSASAIHNSCIEGNSAPDINGVASLVAGLDATANWWGAADGPSGAGAGTGDAVNANVDYSNFITDGCPAGSGAGGASAMQLLAAPQITSEGEAAAVPVLDLPYHATMDTISGWDRAGEWVLYQVGGRSGPAWVVDAAIRDRVSLLETAFALRLGNSANIAVSYYQRGQLASSDSIMLEVLPEGASTWQVVDVQSGLHAADWTEHVVSLSAYRGQVVRLRWRLSTVGETSAESPGIDYWIDDLTIGRRN